MGSNSAIFFLILPIYQETLLRVKDNIGYTHVHGNHFLLPSHCFFSFKSRPHFGKTKSSRKASRKSQKLFPFAEIVEKHGISIHLNS